MCDSVSIPQANPRAGYLAHREEIDGAVAALMKLDANKDGILDAQELVVRGGGGRDGSGRGSQGRNRGGERGSENSNRRGGGQGNGGKAKQASEN